MRAKLSLIDLVNALEATSRNIHWHVDLVTGDVLHPGALPDDASQSRYPRLPRAEELPEKEMRLDFCNGVRVPDVRETLVGMADDGSPKQAFELALSRAGLIDEWICHRRSRLAGLALDWASQQDVTCRDTGRPSFSTL